jgi:PIN domain nuclease of toxin-antitoxin system
VGEGLGGDLSSYLDTQVAVWIALGELDRLSPTATEHIRSTDLLISPTVLLELEYLYEIKRFTLRGQDIARKLEHEVGVRVCGLGFPEIVIVALEEKWTRDPFDRLIVAHAKANGLSPLISADKTIREQYLRAVW